MSALIMVLQLLMLNVVYSNITSSAFKDIEVDGRTIDISPPSPPSTPFAVIGMFFTVMLVLLVAMMLCNLITAHSLAVRRNHMFCLVISGINCLVVPIGTILGVFTIVVLLRPSVKRLFDPSGY